VPLPQQIRDLRLRGVHAAGAGNLQIHGFQIFVAGEPFHRRGVGHDQDVVLVVAAHAGALARQHADDDQRNGFHAHHAAEGFSGPNSCAAVRADDGDLRRRVDVAVAEHRPGRQVQLRMARYWAIRR